MSKSSILGDTLLSLEAEVPISPSKRFVSAWEDLDFPTTSVSDGKGLDEAPPPGLEECSIPASVFQKAKIRPSKIEDSVNLMSKYVSVAVCRQRLHGDVLEEYRRCFLTEALNGGSGLESPLINNEPYALKSGSQIKDLDSVVGKPLALPSPLYFFL